MKEKEVSIANLVLPLPVLEASRSIKRSALSEDSASRGGSGKKCSSPWEMPVLSKTKVGASGDDHGSHLWSSRVKWFACFLILVLSGVVILGTHTLARDWRSLSFCPGKTRSFTSSGFLSALESGQAESGQATSAQLQATDEDDKCWSRTRHFMYRRNKRQTPQSPLLSRALQQYSSLHARCSVSKKWENIIGSPSDVEDSCKYLIYLEGPEGLGNRLLSLVSAFTYALATDRVLLLDSRLSLGSMLCEPFDESSWNLPASFSYEKIDGFPSLDILGKGGIGKEVVALKLNLRHEQSPHDQRFFCADIQEQLSNVRWIAWKSNQYYVTRLLMIPAFWERLSPLFDDPARIFTQLGRHLLLPQNAIWAKMQRVYQAYLGTSLKLVGLQVRAPKSSTYSQNVQDRMMRCVFNDSILPKVSGQQILPGRSYQAGKPGDMTIFVASLHREYYEHWKQMYMEQDTEDGTFVSVHTVASEGVENQSYDQAVDALIDIWLLSFSDTLVTSAWSTFGYVAQGLGAVYPYIVNTDETQAASCWGGQSMEPCTHFPFVSGCSTSRNVEHDEWMRTHLRPCQDEPTGLQLTS